MTTLNNIEKNSESNDLANNEYIANIDKSSSQDQKNFTTNTENKSPDNVESGGGDIPPTPANISFTTLTSINNKQLSDGFPELFFNPKNSSEISNYTSTFRGKLTTIGSFEKKVEKLIPKERYSYLLSNFNNLLSPDNIEQLEDQLSPDNIEQLENQSQDGLTTEQKKDNHNNVANRGIYVQDTSLLDNLNTMLSGSSAINLTIINNIQEDFIFVYDVLGKASPNNPNVKIFEDRLFGVYDALRLLEEKIDIKKEKTDIKNENNRYETNNGLSMGPQYYRNYILKQLYNTSGHGNFGEIKDINKKKEIEEWIGRQDRTLSLFTMKTQNAIEKFTINGSKIDDLKSLSNVLDGKTTSTDINDKNFLSVVKGMEGLLKISTSIDKQLINQVINSQNFNDRLQNIKNNNMNNKGKPKDDSLHKTITDYEEALSNFQ